MIDNATVERIMDAAEIVDVVSDFVTLRRRGANYIACCPFHNEKTPSFSVSPSKGIFKCFGCGKAGNAVSFVMEHEQMSYPEALKYLAAKYGIEVHEQEESQEVVAERLRHESMIAVSEYAGKFYSDSLFNTSEGHSVGLSYFRQRRGFSEETIRRFSLGWSPSGRSFAGTPPSPTLPQAALRNGYKKEFLLATGLCYEYSGELVDKFRERVIFPIHSLSGRIIAFGGRTLREDKSVAKYLNSPESDIYHKSSTLYGIYQAKSAMAKASKCYLVEGYTDVISMNQAGVENVVASSGTSLTVGQIRLIKRFCNDVTVLYDGDAAGIKASVRGIDMLLEEGLVVKVVLLPDGEDPDSFARTHTRQEILQFLDGHETDFIDFKYTLLSADIEKDPIRKSTAVRDIVESIAVIPDQITRSVYIEQCAQKLAVKEEMLYAEVASVRRRKIESGAYEKRRREESQDYPQAGQPEGRAWSSGEGSKVAVDSAMASMEQELLYYLLKFGENTMTFEEHQLYGAQQPVLNITVAEYVSAQLNDDSLELQDELCRRVYGMYFDFRMRVREDLEREGAVEVTPEQVQDRIMRSFVTCGEPEVLKMVLNITEDKYVLSVKEYIRSQIPEANVLNRNVPKAVLVYKLKHVESSVRELNARIGSVGDDADALNDTMHMLKILLKVKSDILKELNRV